MFLDNYFESHSPKFDDSSIVMGIAPIAFASSSSGNSSNTRHRRPWTEQEDELLRRAAELEHPGSDHPSRWLAIAKHVPGRTNKDCRKRWHAKMLTAMSKGGWSAEEDALLISAIEKYGPRWALVASMVGTRKSCQCARRWRDTLDPDINKRPWSEVEDAKLLASVDQFGKRWSHITKTYFPGRTGLAAKNRYVALTTSGRLPGIRKPDRPANASSSSASDGDSDKSSSPVISSPQAYLSDISLFGESSHGPNCTCSRSRSSSTTSTHSYTTNDTSIDWGSFSFADSYSPISQGPWGTDFSQPSLSSITALSSYSQRF